MTEEDAFQFNSALRRAASLAECADLFREFVAPFGFDTFACGEFDARHRERSVFYLIDWPESWRRFYTKSDLINRDPLLAELERRTDPFSWSDLRADGQLARAGREALDRIAAEGWSEGLVIPIKGAGNRLGLVSLIGHRPIGLDAKHRLALASLCLHQHARTLAIRDGFPVPPAGLSERELQAVRCVAQGLSDRDIAAVLNVATSTAHEFIEKAKVKLKVQNRAELIALSVALGIIDI